MDWSIKPQPLIGELLPGFTATSILVAAYLFHDRAALTKSEGLASSGPVLARGLALFLLVSWVLGTLFDAIRDLAEWLLDKYWFEVNWDFLFYGNARQITKLESHWLAYYFLTGNFSVALIVCLVFSIVNRSFIPISIEGDIVIAVAMVIFVANTASMRCELKGLMRTDERSSDS
jgi:hypothetical protein